MKLRDKANEFGQVPAHCIYFNNCGKHCWIDGDYDTDATDCCILEDGIFCDCYVHSVGNKN